MSETPVFIVPEYQGNLTDRQIENREPLSVEEHFALWEEEVTGPPSYIAPELSHETVQAPTAQQVEAQPSIVEQHNRMTDAQNIAYIGSITPYVAAHRDATIRQNLPVYRSDYTLGA